MLTSQVLCCSDIIERCNYIDKRVKAIQMHKNKSTRITYIHTCEERDV